MVIWLHMVGDKDARFRRYRDCFSCHGGIAMTKERRESAAPGGLPGAEGVKSGLGLLRWEAEALEVLGNFKAEIVS